jgi:pilus assembly protein Flp/PilA
MGCALKWTPSPSTGKERLAMFKTLKNFRKDESGATAIEYGLIAALISIAAVAAMTNVGNNLKTIFNTVANNLNT